MTKAERGLLGVGANTQPVHYINNQCINFKAFAEKRGSNFRFSRSFSNTKCHIISSSIFYVMTLVTFPKFIGIRNLHLGTRDFSECKQLKEKITH